VEAVVADAAVAAGAGRLRLVPPLQELRPEQARQQALLLREQAAQPELRAEDAVVAEDAVAAVGAVVLPLLQRLLPLRRLFRSWIFVLRAE
jgi:hypothetical protein